MNTLFQYRANGNCFSNCFIKGCQLFRDSNLIDIEKPELIVFNEETLRTKGKTEYEPALNYLIRNKYQMKIMDPNPENDYGINVSKVSLSKKRFKIADVHRLLDDGWCVIPSAIGKDGIHATHAILIFQDQIWDPMNEDLWVSPKDLTGFNAYFPANELNRHIFAFKK